jgi:hypothetical protein
MSHEDLTDRGLLKYIALRVERMDRTLNGNGRPGLVERVTTMEARMDEPRSKAKVGGFIASITAGVLAFLWNLRQAVT